jgi:hypothetical protein
LPTIGRILTRWAGGPSAPGLTVMNVDASALNAQNAVNAVRAFWSSFATAIPAAYTLTVDPTVELHDQATSNLTGTSTAATPPVSVAGTGASSWAAGVGGRMDWLTGSVVDGRRVRGRTFVIPLISTHYATDGTMQDASVTTFSGYGATLLSALTTASSPMVIWTQHKPGSGFSAATAVTSCRFADQVSVLRGRRVA